MSRFLTTLQWFEAVCPKPFQETKYTCTHSLSSKNFRPFYNLSHSLLDIFLCSPTYKFLREIRNIWQISLSSTKTNKSNKNINSHHQLHQPTWISTHLLAFFLITIEEISPVLWTLDLFKDFTLQIFLFSLTLTILLFL